MKLMTVLAALFVAVGLVAFDATPARAENPRCYNCGSGSSGACKPGSQCFGTEKSCRAKGCKTTSYSSTCSTAANVKKCSTVSEFFDAELPVSHWSWR